MSVASQVEGLVNVILLGPPSHVGLAGDLVAAATGTRTRGRVPLTLAEGVSQSEARKLAGLLAASGCAVHLSPTGTEVPVMVDIAVQPVPGVTPPVDLDRLGGIVGQTPDDLAVRLGRPGGLILSASEPTAEGLRRQLRRVPGIRVVIAAAAGGAHDLFSDHVSADLAADIRRLGLVACAFSGAVAAEVDPATAAHLVARHGATGAMSLSRAFQSFDLLLTGSVGIRPAALDDFLATRGIRRSGAALPSPLSPLRIETALCRAVAQRFQADYAMIGLVTRARLHRPAMV